MILKSDIIIPLNISCRGGFCSNPCKLIVLFGEPSPQGFGFQATWEVRIFTLWAWHLSPTSARNAPHACLISSWEKAWCTTTTCLISSWAKAWCTTTTHVVVVHHAIAQELIRHTWGAFLADVGLRCQAQRVKILTSHVAWKPKP